MSLDPAVGRYKTSVSSRSVWADNSSGKPALILSLINNNNNKCLQFLSVLAMKAKIKLKTFIAHIGAR